MHPDDDWRFPFADAYELRLTTGEFVTSLVGLSERAIECYLNRFGLVPVREGGIGGQRKLARPDPIREWVLLDLDGGTPFEARFEPMHGNVEQMECLLEHDWFSVGYVFSPSLLELSFEPNGDGFSRFMLGGFEKGAVFPAVHDAYWRYAVAERELRISWDDGRTADIEFEVRRELHVASNVKNGGLTFYGATLYVSDHIFPPGEDLMRAWPREYWGIQKAA